MSELGIICEEPPDECEFCGAFEELRPYGPNGERVCFTCAMKNKKAAEEQFTKHVLGITTQ